MMSPNASKLFSRAILQSGSPMMTGGFFTRAEKSVPDFVQSLNCMDEQDEEEFINVDCLRSKPLDEILSVTAEMHKK